MVRKLECATAVAPAAAAHSTTGEREVDSGRHRARLTRKREDPMEYRNDRSEVVLVADTRLSGFLLLLLGRRQ